MERIEFQKLRFKISRKRTHVLLLVRSADRPSFSFLGIFSLIIRNPETLHTYYNPGMWSFLRLIFSLLFDEPTTDRFDLWCRGVKGERRRETAKNRGKMRSSRSTIEKMGNLFAPSQDQKLKQNRFSPSFLPRPIHLNYTHLIHNSTDM